MSKMKGTLYLFVFTTFIFGYLYFQERQNNSLQENLHIQRVNTLQNEKDSLAGLQIALNDKIEVNEHIIKYKSGEIQKLEALNIEIRNRKRVIKLPPDTVTLIKVLTDCEIIEDLLQNAKEEIELLKSRSLVQDNIIADQKELIRNLIEQVNKLEEITEHKNALIEIEKKKGKKKMIGAFFVGYLAGIITPL